jgi:uncharacterized membrane protein
MTENTSLDPSDSPVNVKIVYILYLVGLVVGGITGVVGVVMAYIYRKEAPDWLHSHYHFQIRTFWIGGLYGLIGVILAPVLIGFLILFFWLIWLIVRCVKGISALDRKEEIIDPMRWGF